MLAIEMLLLTGKYVATAYNDRQTCEWPPHPARLFSALAATHHAEPEPDPLERDALQWLELQGPPAITASNTNTEGLGRETTTVFVPVNDITLLGSLDASHSKFSAARSALQTAHYELAQEEGAGADGGKLKRLRSAVEKAEKALAKQVAELESKISRATAPPHKVTDAGSKSAHNLFPEGRTRQPRTFPSVSPDDPAIVFNWVDARPEVEIVGALTRLLARVVRVGHSSSLVRLRLTDDVPTPSLVPDELATRRLRVPLPGQLERLEEHFELHQETLPRVLPAAFQGYAPVGADTATIDRSVFDDDWLVFELVRPERYTALPMQRTVDVARAVRGAMLEHAEPPIPEVLSGHAPDGAPTSMAHVAILPLPHVGAGHADGRLLGVAVALPRTVSREDRRAVFMAIARWERTIAAQNDDDDERVRLPLGIDGAKDWQLRRLDETSRLSTLRPSLWCRAERVWASATPVALDRNPGDLRSKNPRRAEAAFKSAEEIVAKACTRTGLPAPRRVVITRSAHLVGTEKAGRFPSFPGERERSKYQRVLVHALIEFEQKVRGPVVLGAGRYYGLGLFRPLDVELCDTTTLPITS